MGFLSRLGFGSSTSSSSDSAGTSTRSSGMSSGGWHTYDEETARRHHREAQVSLPEASTDRHGRRVVSPDPYAQSDQTHVVRNFGRPYREDGGAQ
ncbi:hypothetical protein AB0D10_42515 [Kitasatospora sp. NPDC048545]|uniref:hypothetical protein n=1 Tax=Kitasatospora sp. NPDC048545 TaxID=3157208 RepID=UPI0033F3E290